MSARGTSSYRVQPGYSRCIELALRVVRAYPNRMPTVDSLQRTFGMSRATAYRWRAALLDAGVLPMGREG